MNYKHGGRHTALYNIWCGIKARCLNPTSAAYKDYGARGITICAAWAESFDAFRRDMGERPPGGMTIERKDNDRGYELSNCVWATWSQQQRNKRTTRRLTIDGKTLSVAEWSEISGVKLKTIAQRLRIGWSHKDAVMQPLVTQRKGVKRGERIIAAFGTERGVVWTEPQAVAA